MSIKNVMRLIQLATYLILIRFEFSENVWLKSKVMTCFSIYIELLYVFILKLEHSKWPTMYNSQRD